MSSRSTEPQPFLWRSEGPPDIRALPSYTGSNCTKGSIFSDMFTAERDKQKSGRGRRRNGLPRAEPPNPTHSRALGTPSSLQATCNKQDWWVLILTTQDKENISRWTPHCFSVLDGKEQHLPSPLNLLILTAFIYSSCAFMKPGPPSVLFHKWRLEAQLLNFSSATTETEVLVGRTLWGLQSNLPARKWGWLFFSVTSNTRTFLLVFLCNLIAAFSTFKKNVKLCPPHPQKQTKKHQSQMWDTCKSRSSNSHSKHNHLKPVSSISIACDTAQSFWPLLPPMIISGKVYFRLSYSYEGGKKINNPFFI